MNSWPPHRYRLEGDARGVPEEIVSTALEQAEKVQSRRLPAVLTLKHLALLTGTNYGYLRRIVGRKVDPYAVFKIGKHSGGFRRIVIPQPPLRNVQRWVSDNILRELSNRNAHPASHAYAPGSSVLRCAKAHAGCTWLVKTDVRKFFESISEIKVYRVFRNAGYEPLVSLELARLCTRVPNSGSTSYRLRNKSWLSSPRSYSIGSYQHWRMGHLPQGAPSSPMLANLVAYSVDKEMTDLAVKYALKYTRYSDDICFSARSAKFERADVQRIIAEINAILRRHALSPNLSKTSVSPPGARKIVLGLLVDGESPRLQREFKDRIRQHLFYMSKSTLAEHAWRRGFRSVSGLLAHVGGLIEYARMIEPHYGDEQKSELSNILDAHRDEFDEDESSSD